MFRRLQKLNDDEQALQNIESAWADCAHGFRTGIRVKDKGSHGCSLRALGLLAIHEHMQVNKEKYDKGDDSMLLWTLRLALEENLPVPYWCADAILEKLKILQTEPSSLHDLLGLAKTYPAPGGKRANNARINIALADELYWRVWQLKAEDNSISKETALQRVRKEYFPHVSQRKARQLLDKKENEQAPLRKAYGLRFGGLRF